MAIARIGPTGYGGWGILWKDFLYMERQGRYSGPFATQLEAEQRAGEICKYYEEPLTIELIPTVDP